MAIRIKYIVLHRVQPLTQKGYILIAHTAFHKGDTARGYSGYTSDYYMLGFLM